MRIQILLITLLLLIFSGSAAAQGCSDAGFCSLSAFHSSQPAKKQTKNELLLSYTYSTHLKNERFYQPQLNYKRFTKNESFFEFRLPFNTAKDKFNNISNSGIGDLTTTFNGRFKIKNKVVDYSAGLRISLSDASDEMKNSAVSLPMFLQSGLGTTDLLAIVNYHVSKYFGIGTGLQAPLFQYNRNQIILSGNQMIISAEGFRRKPDALLKLTGNYNFWKLQFTGALLGIYHLGNDHYNSMQGKYILAGSEGTTLNFSIETSYEIGKNCRLSFLFAEPFKTRSNIPDGLARSKVFNPKLSFNF
ncbi:MAG: hypothetical protein ABJA78_14470 [Ferruginibacter sp.]